MTPEQMQEFLQISLALSAERDREKLLSVILDTAMHLTNCDAGTLYLLEEDGLHFCRMVTLSQGIRQGGHADPITLPPVPLDPTYICSWAVLNNETANVADVHTDQRFDFSGPKKYDAMTGYHTQTMLAVPLANDRGELIGVAQLINAMDENGAVIPFPEDVELLTRAMASQAAISLTNMQYANQVTSLLDSLVGALSTAIDQRTPYNANHTRNMVRYGGKFLDYLESIQYPRVFDADRRRTFLLSVWLHDVGKLVVPLEVMDKESRLNKAAMERVKERLVKIRLLGKLDLAEGKISLADDTALEEKIKNANTLLDQVNRAGFLQDDVLAAVEALDGYRFTDENGVEQRWITEEEMTCLRVRKGTLTAAERGIMESHVSVTGTILEQVSFPKMYAEVPIWAASHHESLNGRGYPNHLTGDDIPWEVRLLSILDVFDALTACDRPYKPAMPLEKALGILHNMVQEGALDEEIVALFEASKAWE